jgi:phospholipid/cholesterol/gamma-HCH transport system substrate-binding protein
MKVKFNKFERVAGLFVLSAIGLSGLGVVLVAIEKGWFIPKVSFKTTFEKANGIFPGTIVEVAGLRAGSVTHIELRGEKDVEVEFAVQARFATKIKNDSTVLSRRPFVIGDKILEVSVGSSDLSPLAEGSLLQSKEGIDLLELGDPQKLAPFIETFGRLTTSLVRIADAFADPKRTEAVVEMFDKINPFLTVATKAAGSVVTIGDQLTRKKNLQVAMENFAAVSGELTKMMIEMPNMSREMVDMIRQMAQAVSELNKMLPAMAQVAPQIPVATDKAMKAMEEAVVVLKAMQKSFLLRGSVKEVQEEDLKAQRLADDKKKADEKNRQPAGSADPQR